MANNERTGIPIREYATANNLTVDAVRMRINRHQLGGYKADGRWYVWVDQAEHERTTTEQANGQTANSWPRAQSEPRTEPNEQPEHERDALIQQLRSEIEFLRDRVERQEQIMAGLVARIPELPANTPQSPQTTGTTAAATEAVDLDNATPGQATRSWWRFWGGR